MSSIMDDEVTKMAAKSKSHLQRLRSKRKSTSTPRRNDVSGALNAIPQKVLLYAARITEPPAISDEAPDEMPFSTEGCDSLIDEFLAINKKFQALVTKSKASSRKPFRPISR